MSKKLITVILALVLTLTIGLTACGSSESAAEKKQITISYMIDGAEHSKETIAEGSAPNLPTPTKDGYTFEKWHLDEWYETEYTEDAFKALEVPEDNTIKLYGRYNKNELTFDEAVAAYKTGKPLYFTGSMSTNNPEKPDEVLTMEYYIDDNCVMMKSYISGPGDICLYYDISENKAYDIDSEGKILAATLMDKMDLTEVPLPVLNGNGETVSVEIGSKTYSSCLKFAATDISTEFMTFVNDGGKLTKVYMDETLYENVVINTEIPTTSSFYGAKKYAKSNLMKYTAVTANLAPDLEAGKAYYFEPIGDKTLAVGDIFLMIESTGWGGAAMAGKITEISGSTYTGLADHWEGAGGQTGTFDLTKIKYILKK